MILIKIYQVLKSQDDSLKIVNQYLVNILPVSYTHLISMSIADRPGLAVGFVGGMLANLGTTYASAFDSSVSVISGGFLGALFAGFVGGYLVLGLKKIFCLLYTSSYIQVEPCLLAFFVFFLYYKILYIHL